MSQEFVFLSNDNIEYFYNIFSNSLINNYLNINMNLPDFVKYIEFLNIKKDVSFILKEDNKNIGIFLSTVKNNIGYVSGIAVLNEHRRFGYGRILLQKGINLLSNYCTSVKLEVIQDNLAAVTLYKNEGFFISNEINNYRNENSSFYSKNNYCGYYLNKDNNFTFNFLYKQFHKNTLPWQKDINILLSKIKEKMCDLYLIYKNDSISGFIIVSRRNNILLLEDIGLNINEYPNFNYFITALICEEKIVQANGFYSDNPLCKVFEKSGFFIDFKQYEMEKKVL
jgi:ribosomal protein S18 acetylase RimI-like enzyme